MQLLLRLRAIEDVLLAFCQLNLVNMLLSAEGGRRRAPNTARLQLGYRHRILMGWRRI